MHSDLRPFATADEAWAALLDQAGDGDGDTLDLVEHALQTAAGLKRAGADDEVIVAGLLHDLGDGRVSAADHASYAADLVRPLFGERVAWLIAAHADAKRYLCATDASYWATLSPVSQRTLLAQGGVMSPEEAAAWQRHPWATDAILLRRCDDGGKNTRYRVADRERFYVLLQRVARA